MVGPRHLFGAVQFHALNLVDVGSHLAGNDIVTELRPPLLAASLARIWTQVGVPAVAQFDNHANFRGGIQPAWQYFSPIVATCLDLGVTPRFIPVREPWRNGIVEHFNDVWDKSFFRTEVFTSIEHLRAENAAFIEFHNTHHRYSAHGGATPNQIWDGRLHRPLSNAYRPPTRLPAQGRIEVVRYVRSNRRVDCSANASPSPRTRPTNTSPPSSRSAPRRSSSSPSTARSSTTATSTSPAPCADRNDVLAEPHLHQRNDVLTATRPPPERNDVPAGKRERPPPAPTPPPSC